MERIIDYLAEEIKKQEATKATKARKNGKHVRIEAMVKAGLASIKPEPMSLDFLGD